MKILQKRLLHYFLLISVDGGHRAVIFDRFTGIKKLVVGEGTHFFIPWVQKPILFDIRSRPRNVPVMTGSKGIILDYSISNNITPPVRACEANLVLIYSDLQNVNITLRILFRPQPDQLPRIYSIIGVDYDDRVLPSITTEVLKAVVVRIWLLPIAPTSSPLLCILIF